MHDGTGWERTEPPAPVRIVHLGLGAFARAHLLWYTQRANESGARRAVGRRRLHRPVRRRRRGARAAGRPVHPAGPLARGRRAHDDRRAGRRPRRRGRRRVARLPAPARGRRRHPDRHRGRLPAHVDGRARPARPRRRARRRDGSAPGDAPSRRPGRLVDGLRARRAAGTGPIAIVSCDNLPDNGRVARRVTLDLASAVDDVARSLDRAARLVRLDDGRPDHPCHHRADRAIVRDAHRPRGPVARSSPSRSASGCSQGEFPAGRPRVGGRRRPVRRRPRAVRAPQALAAQRRPLPARLRGARPRPDHGRRGVRRPRLPRRPRAAVVRGGRRADACPSTTPPRRCGRGSPTPASSTGSPRSPRTGRRSSPSGSWPSPRRAPPPGFPSDAQGRVSSPPGSTTSRPSTRRPPTPAPPTSPRGCAGRAAPRAPTWPSTLLAPRLARKDVFARHVAEQLAVHRPTHPTLAGARP